MCSEVDPVSGVICLDTSGLMHGRHHGLGFDSEGSWAVSWLDVGEIRRLLAESWPKITRGEFGREMSRPSNDAGAQAGGLTRNGPGFGLIQ